jgi:hypothetical protein
MPPKTYISLIFFMLIECISIVAHAIDTKTEEQTCLEIGFKKKTEAHADCVLELLDRKKQRSADKNSVNLNVPQPNEVQKPGKTAAKGDGSPDHVTCEKFGFVVGTSQYSDCRMKMELARKEAQQRQAAYEIAKRQYELESQQYQEQVARYEKEKERQKGEAMMKFGLSLMGGRSPYLSENLANAGRATLGIPPAPPIAPQIQNFTITGPSGRMTSCSVVGNNVNCF